MPRDGGVRLHDDKGAAPVLPDSRDPHPQQPIRPSERQARWTGPFEHLQLVTQREHLEVEGTA